MGSLRTARTVGALLGGTVALLAGCTAHQAPKPVATQPFIAFNACLITDPSGLEPGTTGAQVWAGTQAAVGPLKARASYLTAGHAGLDAALGGLILKKCTLIISAADRSGPAVDTVAKANPGQHFLLIGQTGTAANVRSLPIGNGLQDSVRQAVTASAQGR